MVPLCTQLDFMVVFGHFFFCLVFRSPCYQLSRKKQNKLIHGGVGSIWGDNFYMGTQNGSKLEIWPWRILIHILELKLRPFEVSPYVCIGSHAFAMFSAHALREGRGYARTVTWRPLPTFVKIEVWAACLHCMGLLCIQLNYVVVYGLFFCLVGPLLEKKRIYIIN